MPKLLRCLPLSLAIVMPGLALAAPSTEQAAPADPVADRLASLLVVHVDMEGGEAVAALLHAELVAVLRAAAVAPELPEGAPLQVLVSPDAEVMGAYKVVYQHRDAAIDQWSCACTGDELRQRLRHATLAAWYAVLAAQAPEAPPPAPTVSPEPHPTLTQPRQRARERGFGLWVAGITTTAVGTSFVVGTSALWIAHKAGGRSVDPIALGLWGCGMAMVATGATLWGVGAHRQKRARVSLGFTGRGRGLVFTVGGRF
jgi:hypothetical protein